MSFQLAFTTLACPDWSLATILDAAVRYGYEGIELRLLDGAVLEPDRDQRVVTAAVAGARDAGLAVCALDTSCRFNLADPAERARQVEEARRWIALAYDVAVPILRVFGGADAPGSNAAAADGWVAQSLAALAPDAEAAGVTVALETHDAFSSARRVAEILGQVPSRSIGALWDSHHPYRVGEDPAFVAATLGTRIAHVHVKDARRVAGTEQWDLVLAGEGEVPIVAMLEALTQIGYTGWIAVEWEKKWHPELADPAVALPQHADWLRGALAALQ